MVAGEHASLPRELRWMRRVIDHPVSHAVVYSFCGGLWMLHAGMALGILGRRAGGAAGARLADAGNSVAYIGICTVLLWPVALYLFGLRAAVAAMESDEVRQGIVHSPLLET